MLPSPRLERLWRVNEKGKRWRLLLLLKVLSDLRSLSCCHPLPITCWRVIGKGGCDQVTIHVGVDWGCMHRCPLQTRPLSPDTHRIKQLLCPASWAVQSRLSRNESQVSPVQQVIYASSKPSQWLSCSLNTVHLYSSYISWNTLQLCLSAGLYKDL